MTDSVSQSTSSDAAGTAQPDPLKRLLKHMAQYRSGLIGCALLLAGVAATEPLFGWLLKPLLDRGFSGNKPDYLWLAPVAIVLVFVVRGFFSFTSGYLTAWISNRVLADMRLQMFEHLLRLPNRYFKDTPSANTLNKFVMEANQALQLCAEVFTIIIRESLMVVALLAFLFWLNWKMTLITIVIIPASAYISRYFSKRLRTINQETLVMNQSLTQIVMEGIDGQRVIKLYDGYGYETKRFGRVNERLRSFAMRHSRAAAATVPLSQIVASVALAVVVAVALNQSGNNALTVGGFAAFITWMLQLLAPLKALANIPGPLARMRVALQALFEFLDNPVENDAGQQELLQAQGHVKFEQVWHQFKDAQQPTLHGITLDIQPGQTVAFVGRSGSGKSTLVSLLPRFANPSQGRILLDGHDLQSLSLASLRRHIALVSQDVVLFDDTIAANVAYGAATPPSEEQIRAALQSAQLLDFIDKLPQGIHTQVGENATRLSGGQRQRLAIARALIKNAPILVLDEATSALDNESERQVQASLETLMKGRTTLVIAHRLSTVQNADQIYVLDHGRLIEQGTHTQLLARDGVYTTLYRMQFADGTIPPGFV